MGTWPEEDESEHVGIYEDPFERHELESDDIDDYDDDYMMVNETRPLGATSTHHM